MSATVLANFYKAVRSFWADTDGVILPYVTVMLVVFVGAGALALDGARYMSLQTQMQRAADSYALAGAAELDRLTTSTSRAYNAIQNRMAGEVTNKDITATDITVSSIRFLSALPASDATAISSVLCTNNGCTTAQSVQARFVEVTVAPRTLPVILPVRFMNSALGTTFTTTGTAVAGRDGVSCGLTPIFICNPFEQSGDTYDQATARLEAAHADTTGVFRRQLIRMGDAGGSGTWGPGDFGYLVPEPGTLPVDSCFPSGQEIGKALASDRPLICVRQNGVDLLTGNTNSAKDGINTRFGLYPAGQLSNATCMSTYPPDLNVRKGWLPQASDWCRGSPDGQDTGAGTNWPPGPNNTALGADTCLLGSNACSPNENLGASTWDCAAYWTAVHGPPNNRASPVINQGLPSERSCAAGTMSRYEIHQWETDPARNWQNDAAAANGETGAPQCTPANSSARANRRLLNVAIVNCRSSPVAIQSNAQNVPVAAFGQFFLTHAVTNQTKPYAEFVKLIERGDGVIFDQVQLFR